MRVSVGSAAAHASRRRASRRAARPASLSEYITILPSRRDQTRRAQHTQVVGDEVLGPLNHPGKVADAELVGLRERPPALGGSTGAGPLRRPLAPDARGATADRLGLLEIQTEEVAAVIHINILTPVDASNHQRRFREGGPPHPAVLDGEAAACQSRRVKSCGPSGSQDLAFAGPEIGVSRKPEAIGCAPPTGGQPGHR